MNSPFSQEPLRLSWQMQSSDGLMQHQMNVIPTSTGEEYEASDSLKLRALCDLLIDYLPEEALEEIKNSLLEAVSFYCQPQLVSPSFHLGESFEVAIGEGYERPIFQLMED